MSNKYEDIIVCQYRTPLGLIHFSKLIILKQQPYLQFMAASSFRYSALYTRPTVKRHGARQWCKSTLMICASGCHFSIKFEMCLFLTIWMQNIQCSTHKLKQYFIIKKKMTTIIPLQICFYIQAHNYDIHAAWFYFILMN